ncbi:MAG TPA: hypothetical protein VJ717_12705 [Gemmatimonadaceae bacterium]|nr:hypothetical protein [Gemmatimonadaceae bacterium]
MPRGRWSPAEYNKLEAAIAAGARVSVLRLGGELVVVPRRLGMRGGRETIEALHPATGEVITFMLDEIEALEVVA